MPFARRSAASRWLLAKHHPAPWRSTSDAAHVGWFTWKSPLCLISSRTHSKLRFAIVVGHESPSARTRARPRTSGWS